MIVKTVRFYGDNGRNTFRREFKIETKEDIVKYEKFIKEKKNEGNFIEVTEYRSQHNQPFNGK